MDQIPSELQNSNVDELQQKRINSMRKLIKIGAAVIALLLLANGAAAFLVRYQYNRGAKEAELAKQQVEKILTGRVAKDPIAGWKTYRNEEYGFEFKYPSNLSLQTCSDTLLGRDNELLKSNKIFLLDPSNPRFKSWQSLEDFCSMLASEQYDGPDIFTLELIPDSPKGYYCEYIHNKSGIPVKGIMVGGEKALSCDVPGLFVGFRTIMVVIDTFGRSIVIESDYDENDKTETVKLHNQILSTFKFIDKTVGVFCGGIAGKLCPSGYDCKLDGNYPDAGGTCIRNSNTGILMGHVTIGPICPVERVGVVCTPSPEAYASREFIVFDSNQKEVTRFHADANGSYGMTLSAGTYSVVPAKTGIGFMSKDLPSTITVKAGQSTTLNIDIDTGIR